MMGGSIDDSHSTPAIGSAGSPTAAASRAGRFVRADNARHPASVKLTIFQWMIGMPPVSIGAVEDAGSTAGAPKDCCSLDPSCHIH